MPLPIAVVVHSPYADVDYIFDWDRNEATSDAGTGYLATGETITTSSWTITPAGPVLHGAQNTTTTTKVSVRGGLAGQDYSLSNVIVTSAGNTDQYSITLESRVR